MTFITGVAVTLLFLNQCNRIDNLKQELANTERVSDRNFNNYLAAQDSLRIERNEKNEKVAVIRSYEFEVASLNSENQKLIRQYQDALLLNKRFEKINNLISAELQVKDSIIASGIITQSDDTLTVDLADKKEWDKYNWRSFNGQVRLLRLSDSTYNLLGSNFLINQGISLKMAIVEEDGINLLKVTSPYPNLEFTQIENINLVNDRLNIPTKTGGWSVGIGVGYGLNLDQRQQLGFGPTIGIGIYYSPKWLRF
jgi:hypothetical protein